MEKSTMRDRLIVVGVLSGFSLIAWIYTIRWSLSVSSLQGGVCDMHMGALLFLAMWCIMQVAMMFPSVEPMVITYATISRKQPGSHQLRTAAFLLGYLAVWTFTGTLAYTVWLIFLPLGSQSTANSTIVGALIFMVSGIYQLTPLKYHCLSHCRSPLSFFIQHPVGRTPGSGFRIGLHHGIFCVACCWSLMAILFAVGLMNLLWMGLLTLAIFFEKIHSKGMLIGKVIGILFICLGLISLIKPEVFALLLFG